jgi:hypothetical protein
LIDATCFPHPFYSSQRGELLTGDDLDCEPTTFPFAPETTGGHPAKRKRDLCCCGQTQGRVGVRLTIVL